MPLAPRLARTRTSLDAGRQYVSRSRTGIELATKSVASEGSAPRTAAAYAPSLAGSPTASSTADHAAASARDQRVRHGSAGAPEADAATRAKTGPAGAANVIVRQALMVLGPATGVDHDLRGVAPALQGGLQRDRRGRAPRAEDQVRREPLHDGRVPEVVVVGAADRQSGRSRASRPRGEPGPGRESAKRGDAEPFGELGQRGAFGIRGAGRSSHQDRSAGGSQPVGNTSRPALHRVVRLPRRSPLGGRPRGA